MNVSFKPKPISDEEAWEAALAWAEAKAQERKVLATKEESQTDTDESYDSDDIEVGVSIHPVDRRAMDWSFLFAGSDTDEDEDNDKVEELVRGIVARWVARCKIIQSVIIIQAAARGRAVRSGGTEFFITTHDASNVPLQRQCWWVKAHTLIRAAAAMATIWNVEKRAATIIQAAARGRAARAWNPFVSAPLAAMAGLMRAGDVVRANVYSLNDAAAAAAMWREDARADAYESVATKKALEALDEWLPSPRKYTAATIIQAAARGRAARLAAWDATYAALDAALLMRLRKERRRAAKDARRALNAALNPSTWYRV
jgi:hypothetical protein